MSYTRITPNRDRPSGVQILSLFGIPVYVEAGFLFTIGIILFLMSGGGSIDWHLFAFFVIAIFFSILFHEYGHAEASRLAGCDMIRISLVAMGGYATHSPTDRTRSLLIVLAGPFVTFVLFLVGHYGLVFIHAQEIARGEYFPNDGAIAAVRIFLELLRLINLFLLVFNLLPIYPMDGGQALFFTFSHKMSERSALLLVSKISLVACVIVGYLAYQMGFTIAALFCLMFFMDNLRIAQSA